MRWSDLRVASPPRCLATFPPRSSRRTPAACGALQMWAYSAQSLTCCRVFAGDVSCWLSVKRPQTYPPEPFWLGHLRRGLRRRRSAFSEVEPGTMKPSPLAGEWLGPVKAARPSLARAPLGCGRWHGASSPAASSDPRRSEDLAQPQAAGNSAGASSQPVGRLWRCLGDAGLDCMVVSVRKISRERAGRVIRYQDPQTWTAMHVHGDLGRNRSCRLFRERHR